jgi:hypothetical protein
MVLQCNMDFMKVECDQDGESFETSDRYNHLIELKEEKDPLLTVLELESGTEVSCTPILFDMYI